MLIQSVSKQWLFFWISHGRSYNLWISFSFPCARLLNPSHPWVQAASAQPQPDAPAPWAAVVMHKQKLRQPLKGEGWERSSAGDEAEAVLQNWGERQNLMWSYNFSKWWYIYLLSVLPVFRKAITIMGHKMTVDTKCCLRSSSPVLKS